MRKTFAAFGRGMKKVALVSDRKVFIVTALYLLGSVFVSSHKLFFIVSSLYFILLYFFTGSIKKTIIYAFLPFWLLRVGRAFTFQIIPGEFIESPLYWEGRSLGLEFSPFFVLVITSVIVMFAQIFDKKHKLYVPVYFVFFLILYVFHFISAGDSLHLAGLSFLYTILEFSFLVWALILLQVLIGLSQKEKNRLLVTIFLILVSLVFLEGGVVLLQVIKRSTLGLGIEKVISIPSFGAGAEENPIQFRPIGLNYHANALANWHVALLFSIFMLWFRIKKFIPQNISSFLITTTVGLSLFILLLTLSRSAYLAIFIPIGIFALLGRETLTKTVEFLKRYLADFKLPILLILIYLSFIIPDRILGTLYSFTETGGFTTRGEQISEAMQLFRSFPLFGVGIGMFIPALFLFNPGGSVRYFPENVHNGFVLFLAERGVLAAIVYLFGLYLLIRSLIKFELSKEIKLLAVSGIIGNYIMMLFQPFVNTLPLNVLILGVLVGLNKYEKNK